MSSISTQRSFVPCVSLWRLHAEVLREETDLHCQADELREDFRLVRLDLNSCLLKIKPRLPAPLFPTGSPSSSPLVSHTHTHIGTISSVGSAERAGDDEFLIVVLRRHSDL